MKYIKHLLQLLSKSEKRKLLLVFFGVLVLGVLELAGIGSIIPFLSVASNPSMVQENVYLKLIYDYFNFKTNESFLYALGIGAVVFLFVSNGMKALVTYMNKRYTTMRHHHLARRLFRRYLYQPYAFFLNKNSAELIKNILGEIQTLVNYALMPLLDLVTSIIIAILIVIMLILVNPALATITFLVIGSSYGIIYIFVKKRLDVLGKRRIESNSLRYKKVSEALGGIKDVKILGREEFYLKEFTPPSIENARVQVSSALIGSIPPYALEVIAFGGLLLIVLFLMNDYGNFHDAVPIIGLYTFAAYRIMPSLKKIFTDLAKLKSNLPVVELIHENIGAWEEEENRIRTLKNLNLAPLPFTKELNLTRICFTYPMGEEPVIKDQSCTIKKDTTVGIVGPTGCGKTTMVDIILGLLEPQEGEIKVDNCIITQENVGAWQKHMGYVPQQIYLADDTVTRNIAFGVPEKLIDRSAVERAAKIANINEFIENELPKQYETIVGERGIRLSGGQRQRIGIARALYNDPAVLVLDEATSALDGLTEAIIMEAIHALGHKKTIIIIAHRLSTVRECDQIIAMDKGIVIDTGTYDELVSRNEGFRKIAEMS